MRGLGYLTGLALVVAGIGWVIGGMFAGEFNPNPGAWVAAAGVVILVLTSITDVQTIPSGHPDQFGSLDCKERGL